MIRLPTKTQLSALQDWREPNCVTVYAPYIESNSSGKNPNQTQLKVLLKEAEGILLDKHLSQRDVDFILDPGLKMLDGEEFTTSSKHGLVLFLHHDFFDYYHLPTDDVEKAVIVGKGFKLRPITKLLEFNLVYYILTISCNGMQLLKGDSYHIKRVKFQKIPKTMLQELNIDEFQKPRGLHTVANVSKGKGSKVYHGEFEKSQINKDMLTTFFRRINTRLYRAIKGKQIPLILAGVDYLLPIYRKVNTYPYLVSEDIKGSMEHTSLDAIREQACEIMVNNQTNDKLESIAA